EALARLLRMSVALTVAGRTDAGVHAAGQVAHADLPATADGPELVRRLARLLPPDVRVKAVEPAPAGYDTLIWPRVLDRDAMQAAADRLLGEHDFAAFCRRREGASTVRTLQQLDWARDADGVLTATVRADAFCHSMVRSLVGALL